MLKALKNLFKELFALRLGKLEDYFWAIFGTIIMITIPSKIADFFLDPVPQVPPVKKFRCIPFHVLRSTFDVRRFIKH